MIKMISFHKTTQALKRIKQVSIKKTPVFALSEALKFFLLKMLA